MPLVQRLPLAAALLAATPLLCGTALATPRVVADIPPVHSIAARVMAGVAEPGLIVPPGASPHGYALRPSEARELSQADVVFWVGPDLAPWLEGPIAELAGGAETLELMHLDGMTLLPFRQSAAFEPHDHAEVHDHADVHDHAEDHDHDHGQTDPHVWLDPENAVVMARAMAESLAAQDPEHAASYRANAAAFAAEMAALETSVSQTLAGVDGQSFVVFHDSIHYFEARFGVEASGAISLGDGSKPSAARVAEIRDQIRHGEVVCVFAEPQFDASLVVTLVEGSGAGSGTLDPVGASLEPGPDLYPALLEDLAENLTACLARR